MRKEIFKNRKKIIREFPNEDKREIEIHFTLLYKSRLYACFHFLDDETTQVNCMRFTLADQELHKEGINPDEAENLLDIMALIEDESGYEPGQHFVWLEDKQSLVLEEQILENNQEQFLRRLYERTTKARKIIQKGAMALSILLLLCVTVAGICLNQKVWESIFQYRYFSFGEIRISAFAIRFMIFFIYMLLWAAIWCLLKKKMRITRLCISLIGTVFLAAGSTYILSENTGKWINRFADPMEYMYSIVQASADGHQDIYVELQEDKAVIPIGIFKVDSQEPIEFEAWLERNTFPGEMKTYAGVYNKQEDVVEIEIPELASDYEYGLLTVVRAEEPTVQTVIPLGTRPLMWYQRLLGTTAEFEELCSADSFAEAVNSGKVGADKWLITLWSFLISFNGFNLFDLVYKFWFIWLGLGAIYCIMEDRADRYSEEWKIATRIELEKLTEEEIQALTLDKENYFK